MIDRDIFFPLIRKSLGNGVFNQGQVDGFNTLLDAWEKYCPAAIASWIAYSLATAWHETAQTMQPLAEYDMGAGRSYGVPAGPWRAVYYGRGYVQLTWEHNYAHATLRLQALNIIGADINLEQNPDLAMRPDIAAAILIIGMIEGWFTGHRLSYYLTPESMSWAAARQIVNGLDKAGMIADYAEDLYRALTAAKIAPIPQA